MTAVLLTGLFIFSGGAALMTIARGWRTLTVLAPALRRELLACSDYQDVRLRTAEIRVSRSAAILRPEFTRGQRRSAADGLPVAA